MVTQRRKARRDLVALGLEGNGRENFGTGVDEQQVKFDMTFPKIAPFPLEFVISEIRW